MREKSFSVIIAPNLSGTPGRRHLAGILKFVNEGHPWNVRIVGNRQALVPLLQTVSDLGLYDTHWGLILVHTVYGMPMCTSMFRGFYSDIPDALIKQAMIDGNGPWQIYWKIVLPNTTIATVTVLVFQCTSVWNEMLFALTLGGFDCMPATIALNQMVGSLSAEFNMQMAGSIWLTLPVLVLYMFLGKYLIRGYMAGAVTAS